MSIQSHLTCHFVGDDPVKKKDAFASVRPLFKEFNDHREKFLEPGLYILVDECMMPWKGKKTEWNDLRGAAAIYKIIRKPKGIGLQLKALIDCSSKIMLRLELCEGKDLGPTEYDDIAGLSGGVVFRLAEPWFDSHRILIGDSAFSSIKLALEVLKKGLYYIGSLKTNTSLFPMKALRNKDLQRGETFAMEAGTEVEIGGKKAKVMTAAWRDKGKTNKTVLATAGSTDNGKPVKRYSWSLYYSLKTLKIYPVKQSRDVERSDVVARDFDNFHWIDVIDHLRQGILRLHEFWQTHSFLLRVWATILGIIFTDAYFVWLKINQLKPQDNPYIDFIDRLAFQLIGDEDKVRTRPKKKRKTHASTAFSQTPDLPTLKSIKETKEYAGRKGQVQLRCNEGCGSDTGATRTSYCCRLCYETGETIIPLCAAGPTPCFFTHACRAHRAELLKVLTTDNQND